MVFETLLESRVVWLAAYEQETHLVANVQNLMGDGDEIFQARPSSERPNPTNNSATRASAGSPYLWIFGLWSKFFGVGSIRNHGHLLTGNSLALIVAFEFAGDHNDRISETQVDPINQFQHPGHMDKVFAKLVLKFPCWRTVGFDHEGNPTPLRHQEGREIEQLQPGKQEVWLLGTKDVGLFKEVFRVSHQLLWLVHRRCQTGLESIAKPRPDVRAFFLGDSLGVPPVQGYLVS